MALTFSHLDTVVSTGSTSSSQSNSLSPSVGDTLLVTYMVGSGTGMDPYNMTISSTLSGLSDWRRVGIAQDNGTNSLILVVFWAEIFSTPGSGTITCGGQTSSRRVLHVDKVAGAKTLYPVVNTATTSGTALAYSSDPNQSLTGMTNDGTGTFGAAGFRDAGGSTSDSITNRTSGGAAGPYTTLSNDRALASGTAVHRTWTGYQTTDDTSLYSFMESDGAGTVDTACSVLLAINDQTVGGGGGGGSALAYGFAG